MVSFLGQKDIRWCLVFKGCHCYTFTHILKATSVENFFFSFWLVKSRKELKRAIIMNDLPYAFWWWCHCQSPSYFVPNCLFPILLQRFTDSHKLPHWKNSNRPENSLPLLTGPLRLGFHTRAKNNFLSRNYHEFDASKMWILWKIRIENVNFI